MIMLLSITWSQSTVKLRPEFENGKREMLTHNNNYSVKERGYQCFNALCDALEKSMDPEMHNMIKDMAYQCLCVSPNFEDINDLISVIKESIPSSKFNTLRRYFLPLMELEIVLKKTLPSIVERWKHHLLTYEDALYLLQSGYVSLDILDVVLGERKVAKNPEAVNAYIEYHNDEELRKTFIQVVGDQYIWQIRDSMTNDPPKRDYRTNCVNPSVEISKQDNGDKYIHRHSHTLTKRYEAQVKMARLLATNIIEEPEDIGERWRALKTIVEDCRFNDQILLMEERILKKPSLLKAVWLEPVSYYDPEDYPAYTRFGLHNYICLLQG